MEFNTLDAQRESCEAYITSQRSEGWQVIKKEYTDGGYSGGNMNRPGLQDLLDDIKSGEVDIVVVYKIDRLTRSLIDFSKLVEVFDAHNVTFVSVTQSFNTTTSMGRLTLNVLLSFAQFEREVSAERIHDKISATKKKGMWVGGTPPLGYKLDNGQLAIEESEVEFLHHIYKRYVALKSVKAVIKELEREGRKSPERYSKAGNKRGGGSYSRGALHAILKNPIYVGKLRHKDKIYDGQQPPLIDQALWDEVQDILNKPVGPRNGQKLIRHKNLLEKILYDEDGSIYSPANSRKSSGTSYRYYVSQRILQYRDHPGKARARLPAHEMEQAVIKSLLHHIKTPSLAANLLLLNPRDDWMIIDYLEKNTIDAEELVRKSVTRVVIGQNKFDIHGDLKKLRDHLEDILKIKFPRENKVKNFCVSPGLLIKRSYKGSVILSTSHMTRSIHELPAREVRNLVRGIIWRERHFAGESIQSIADKENFSDVCVRRIIKNSFDTLMAL